MNTDLEVAMQRDAIPNSTGDVWEYVSSGPDHAAIKTAYFSDPCAWEVQTKAPLMGFSEVLQPCWYHNQKYRMRRKAPAMPVIDDMVNRPAHYASGEIECIDAMVAAFGEADVLKWAQINAFKYLWRAEKKNGKQDIEKAIWYLRYSNGDDPRKDR